MVAHSLPKSLERQGLTQEAIDKKIEQCEIGVRYQLFHAPVILALGLAASFFPDNAQGRIRGAAVSFLIGTVLFSGGLYSMVFLGFMGHWSIVPSGGLSLMIGWCFVLGLGLVQLPSSSSFSQGKHESTA